MGEQELNRNLAERAGFTYIKEYVPCYGHTEENDPDPLYLELWKNPSGELVTKNWDFGQHIFEPNFTQSLDACFKLLVPIAIDKIMAEQGCSSDVAYAILFKKWLQELELIIPEAALALCLAIEKLINQEVRNKEGDKQ